MSVAQMGHWNPGGDETWFLGHCLGIVHGNVSVCSFLLALRDKPGQGPWKVIAFVGYKARSPAMSLERPGVTNGENRAYTIG